MSLQVWLPLNGDFINKGASGIQFKSEGGATSVVATPGKITPNCYYNNSHSTGGLVSKEKIDLGSRVSMCCWMKFATLTSSSSLGGAMGGTHRHGNNTGMGLTIKYVSSTTGYLSLNTGTGSTRTYNKYTGSTLLQANTWYHVCYTYDESKIKLYVNGKLDGTHSYTDQKNVEDYVVVGCWSLSGTTGSTPHGGYKLNGNMNDFRIYDHCLSAREVSEIAKGLVAHYQLNNSGMGGNLLIDSNVSATNTSYPTTMYTPSPFLVEGETYTLTMCVTPGPGITHFTPHLSQGYTGIGTMPVSGEGTQILSKTFSAHYASGKTPADNVNNGVMRIYRYPRETATDSTVHWVVITKGTEPVDTWIPHHSISGAIEYDCSGFGYDGTKTGSLLYTSDTPRNDFSTIFDGSTTGITLPIKDLMKTLLADKCTVSFWAKDSNTSSRSVFFGGYNGSNFNIEQTGTDFRVYWNGSPDLRYSGVVANEWAMWTVTTDIATGIKIYKNGVEVKTHNAALTNFVSNFSRDFSIGRDSRSDDTMMEGIMSDLRIYGTALSAEDILDLYKVPISISETGAVLGYMFKEGMN